MRLAPNAKATSLLDGPWRIHEIVGPMAIWVPPQRLSGVTAAKADDPAN
jgi:hypothetical protein